MKSAYELAMERLEAESGPTKKLTDEQKEQIAEIERKFDARVAEVKLEFDAKFGTADFESQPLLQDQLVHELASLEEKREQQKEAVWGADD